MCMFVYLSAITFLDIFQPFFGTSVCLLVIHGRLWIWSWDAELRADGTICLLSYRSCQSCYFVHNIMCYLCSINLGCPSLQSAPKPSLQVDDLDDPRVIKSWCSSILQPRCDREDTKQSAQVLGCSQLRNSLVWRDEKQTSVEVCWWYFLPLGIHDHQVSRYWSRNGHLLSNLILKIALMLKKDSAIDDKKIVLCYKGYMNWKCSILSTSLTPRGSKDIARIFANEFIYKMKTLPTCLC